MNTHVKKIMKCCNRIDLRNAEEYDKLIRGKIKDISCNENISEELRDYVRGIVDTNELSGNERQRKKQINKICSYYEENDIHLNTQSNFFALLATLSSFAVMIYGIFDYVNDFCDIVDNSVYASIMIAMIFFCTVSLEDKNNYQQKNKRICLVIKLCKYKFYYFYKFDLLLGCCRGKVS